MFLRLKIEPKVEKVLNKEGKIRWHHEDKKTSIFWVLT